MKTLKPHGNDIQMSTAHENRFAGAAKPAEKTEDKA